MTASRRHAGPQRQQRHASLQADLAAVAVARLSELRAIWSDRLNEDPPTLRSPEIFRRMLAYRLQEAVHGGLSAACRRRLAQIEARRAAPPAKASPAPVRINPGATLIRVWKGVRHEVRVVAGGYDHEGQSYKSLSEVARAITGTRWNGPLFFGLRDKAKEAA
jgi:hypothetical protein